MDVFRKLVLSSSGPARVRYEATVGAGLPVIASLGRVVGSADDVSLISGSFSGTLGYVMSGLQSGGAFSDVVAKAKELGYTEPDPRDDLGGVDVRAHTQPPLRPYQALTSPGPLRYSRRTRHAHAHTAPR